MSEDVTKFLELVKSFESLKDEYKAKKKELHEVAEKIGVGGHFQDPETKLVYEIIVPTGTFISFDSIGYQRTKTSDEKKGSLSMKRAEELGYTVK